MTGVGTAAAPTVRPAARVEAVDLARGFALIGMMLIHLGPYWIERDPEIGHVVAGGRAAPLFAILAGVALTLVHQQDPRGAGSARATCIRGVILVALGLSLGSIQDMPVLVILAFYGLMIVAALPFRRLPTRALMVLAAVWVVVAPVGVVAAQVIHAPVRAGQAELPDLAHPGELVLEVLVFGAYPAVAWFAYLLVGLVVGRLDLRGSAVAWRLVAVGAVLVAATLAIGWALIKADAVGDRSGSGWRLLFRERSYPFEPARWDELLLVGQHTSTPLNVLSAIGSALLMIGICALAIRVPWARLLLWPIRAAGAMTLTLYTIHVLWAWRLRVADLGADGNGFPRGSYDEWLLQVMALCAAAALWQRFVGRGPLEWLVRRLSVWDDRARA
jgi:uncharacterized protein